MLVALTAFLAAQTALARSHPRHAWPRTAWHRHHAQKNGGERGGGAGERSKHNQAALMILGGRPGTSYFDIAHDMADALAEGDGIRLIPMDAAGGIGSLQDLLLLRGVDLALVPGNVLAGADRTAALGPGLRERLTYVTALYGEEVHVVAGRGVSSFENLRGRKVAVPPDDRNAEFTARDLLRLLHVEAEIVRVATDDAIDGVRSGSLAALFIVGGKPLPFVAGLPKDGSVHLLALTPAQALGDGYSPGRFGADDYPALIAGRRTIDTVSVTVMLLARRTARPEESHQRVTRFVPAFFGALSDLGGPRSHPKWRDVNLAATHAGWRRFPAAREWLDTALREQSKSVQQDFERFLRIKSPAGAPSSSAGRRQLFEQYVMWMRRAAQAPR
jgi:uncharacterized protein